MIVSISPARLQDFETPTAMSKCTPPQFEKEAIYLNSILQSLSVQEIEKLMHINPKQALEVYQYVQAFEMKRTPKKQAALTYNGMAYLGLDAKTFTDDNWNFAQQHLIHFSGMYGALRPLDAIKPYRLEALIKLPNNKGKDLYDYWSSTLTTYLAQRLEADDNVWINLMSKEFTKLINKKSLGKEVSIITPAFKQQTANGYKQIVIYSKKARGMMARYIIQNKIKKVDDLKYFDAEGYSFAPDLSVKDEWVFVR
ncbi:MAG: peroxide stress protein YaaA [Bacteroidota bacterium]|jgi:cytoplasmic iron level regulating protein YaaA (DUF328/UPF0246 family)